MMGYDKHVTVIMDGSSRRRNNEITDIIDMVIGKRIGKTKSRKLDDNHPTMRVITTTTTAENYRRIRRLIEALYPGLCIFDPVM